MALAERHLESVFVYCYETTLLDDNVPKISVILPVYNGQDYLEAAVASVLSQSFGDFELLIINDGSSDNSASIVEKMGDPRIRFFQQTNRGLAATLNRAISLARGEYIARQDQDDVYLPARLQKQVEFLDTHPDVGMVGTSAEIFAGNERTTRFLRHPTDNASIKLELLFSNCFVHSSIMIRRAVFNDVGGYSEDKTRQPPEDYELWSRVMKKYKLANLPEALTAYREVQGSMSRTGENPFVPNLVKISAENIAWAAGLEVGASEVVALSRLSHGVYEGIPPGVGLSRLRGVITSAAERIAQEAGAPLKQLEPILQARLNRLNFQYADYCSGGLIKRLMHAWMGSRVKNFLRRILGVSHL